MNIYIVWPDWRSTEDCRECSTGASGGVPGPLRLPVTLLHCDEEEADGRRQQQVHGLVQQFGGKDAPDEEVVAQNGHQHDVGGSRHGPQQGQTVAAVAHGHGAPGERTGDGGQGRERGGL